MIYYESLKRKLLTRAFKRYRKVYPCASVKNFSECYSIYNNKIYFWFNTEDGNTHVLDVNI
jgi:hypothetical protein